MVELTSIDILNGLLSIIQVILTIIIGGILIFKYFKYKNRPLLFMGLALILLTEVWFTHGLVLILVLTTGNGLSPQTFFILSYSLVPWTLVIWMALITELIYKKYQKVVLFAYIVFGIVFQVIFYTFLFLDYKIIGDLVTPIEVVNAPFMIGYLFIILINVFITGFLFFRESRRSNDPEIRLKGSFFVMGCTVFVIASILDTFALNFLALIMVRILFVVFSILVYIAFLLPNWIKKSFFKK